MNGSRFYSSSSTQSSFRSSNRSKYPGLARKPSSSSTSSPVASIKSGSSLHNGNGLSNGFANSTTAYLLGGKVNSGGAPVNPTSNSLSSHSQFSKSLLNVSSSNWDWDDDGPGQSYPSSNGTGQHPTSASYSTDYRASTYDLLSGLNFDPSNGTSNNYQNSNASSRSQYSRNSFNDHSSSIYTFVYFTCLRLTQSSNTVILFHPIMRVSSLIAFLLVMSVIIGEIG